MNNYNQYAVNNFTAFRNKMLNWANQFNIFCFLDNQQYSTDENAFECLLGVGARHTIHLHSGNAFESLKVFHKKYPGWLFGHLGYDLKNEIEAVTSTNTDIIGFEDGYFFVPETVIQVFKKHVRIISTGNATALFDEINNYSEKPAVSNQPPPIAIQSRFSQLEYIETIKALLEHIHVGDCYEINFCQEFFAENVWIDPILVFDKLCTISPNPFAALYKLNDKYCICASPERFLKKQGYKLISQPIKGTSPRDLQNRTNDDSLKNQLFWSSKERSENVMVVDLVRNDLSKICTKGSVKVEELFGIYSFPQVHQMISTVSGEMPPDLHWVEAIRACFPMGSMTGAPKKKVMQLIEKYEKSKRGLFSGAIGYIMPSTDDSLQFDFDFNVVIRSLLYNASAKSLSYQTGSGITFYSDPELEYEECQWKGAAIKKLFE